MNHLANFAQFVKQDWQVQNVHRAEQRSKKALSPKGTANRSWCSKMGPSEIETNFMLLRRELKKSKSFEALQIVDKIETTVIGRVVHSCPICGETLVMRDLAYWTCNGMFHGSPIDFYAGQKHCTECSNSGPYCNLNGYCLRQRFVSYGKPIICITGRIDDQSPRWPCLKSTTWANA